MSKKFSVFTTPSFDKHIDEPFKKEQKSSGFI